MGEDILIRVRRALERLASERSWLQGNGLVKRLAEALKLGTPDVKQALKDLAMTQIIDGISPLSGDPVGRVRILQSLPPETPEVAAHELAWREVVAGLGLAGLGLETEQEAALIELAPVVAELGREDMENLAQGIVTLARATGLETRDPYEASAKHLLGSSKILAQIEKALKPLGITPEKFGTRPRYVLGAGPEKPDAVLLVENPEVFDRIIRLGPTDRITVIATFGYGLSWSGIAAEGRLENFRIARVAGNPPATLAQAIDGVPCYFWGDLDHAGLGIYLSLKSIIPDLALSALYQPMLAALKQKGANHPYCTLVDKAGQLPLTAADPAVQALAQACLTRAVDQELVSDDDIRRYTQNGLLAL